MLAHHCNPRTAVGEDGSIGTAAVVEVVHSHHNHLAVGEDHSSVVGDSCHSLAEEGNDVVVVVVPRNLHGSPAQDIQTFCDELDARGEGSRSKRRRVLMLYYCRREAEEALDD